MIGRMFGRMTGAAGLFALAAALQAQAQTPPKPVEEPPKQLTGPNVDAIREGMKTVHEAGSCTVTFIVAKTAQLKDMKADCTIPEMAPFALKAMETVTYTADTFDGSTFDSEPIKMPFSWPASGAAAAVTQPVVTKQIDERVMNSARRRVGADGKCDSVFTVGVDGVPKDIKTTCQPPAYEAAITEAVAQMRYKPAQSGGKPVEMPGMSLTLRLGKQ